VLSAASDNVAGQELWKSDGTPGGTVMVKDICPGSCWSTSMYLSELNSILYFQAFDGPSNYELWRSDGTLTGTYVLDLVPGIGSWPTYMTPLAACSTSRLNYRAMALSCGPAMAR
jgi:ELWxxDGT repeat protein